MTGIDLDMDPVSIVTTDAIGQPGQRTFYLQARHNKKVISLLVEKVQIQSLAIGLEEYLEEIAGKYPNLPQASADYDESQMHISPPVDPLFRVGELGLAYDPERDMVILVAREILGNELDQEDASIVRMWCTRSQIMALCAWGLEVTGRGRPICPHCGEPMEPEGHFCPKKNGHKH